MRVFVFFRACADSMHKRYQLNGCGWFITEKMVVKKEEHQMIKMNKTPHPPYTIITVNFNGCSLLAHNARKGC